MDEDPNEFRGELFSISSAVFMVPVTLAYLIFQAFRISAVYFLIVSAVSLVKFFVPVIAKKAEQKYHMEEKKYLSEVRSCETDFTSRAYLINIFGLTEPLISLADKRFDDFFKKTKKKSNRLNSAVNSIQAFANVFCSIAVLLAGAYMVAVNMISPGGVAAMMGYYSVLNTVVSRLDYIIRKTPILDNLAERLYYFYDGSESVNEKSINRMDSLKGENLSFAYEDRKIFDRLSFEVNSGDRVAICGKNGSGKSTLMKIMLGLIGGFGGSLKVNDEEASSVNPDSYRALMAYAPQDPYLFQGTVIDNIKLAKPDADESEIKQLMLDFGILNLADREIGGGGYELSGGEKQKISIIRAVIGNAPFIFADEPENNLDTASLEKLKAWICSSNKTIIFVSHNPGLIACANKKIVCL